MPLVWYLAHMLHTLQKYNDEHRVCKETVPGLRRNDPDRQAIGRISPSPAILYEQVLPGQRGQHALFEPIEFLRINRSVDLAPVYVRLARGLLHDELVGGRAASEGRRVAHDRPLSRE